MTTATPTAPRRRSPSTGGTPGTPGAPRPRSSGPTPSPGSWFPAQEQHLDHGGPPRERFAYQLVRTGEEWVVRWEFDLTETVEPPPAPWGYEDTEPTHGGR
jgi:hypothetical protein